MAKGLNRRGFLRGGVTAGTAAGFIGLEEKILLAAIENGADKKIEKPAAKTSAEMPTGKIGDLNISRLIIGGNLIGGWAHARDLMNASELFKAYNTEPKIFDTLELAEQHGINTAIIDYRQLDLINKYKQQRGGKIQAITSVMPQDSNPIANIDEVIQKGAATVYLHGAVCDFSVQKGRIEILEKAIEHIRKNKVTAGIGAHSHYVLVQCQELGIKPDYYVKTLHHDKYWSAHPRENRKPFSVDAGTSDDHNQFHDNMFCLEPQETIELMKKVEVPWVAFKTLAAGAISPSEGFKYAFENGADFVAVGMFDFQISEDVVIARQTLAQAQNRQRAWRA